MWSRTKPKINWMATGALLVSLLAPSCAPPDPNAPAIFRDSNDYQTALARVKVLTQRPFEAMHEGFPISPREEKDLHEALHLIDGMIVYNPQTYAPYVLKGLTLRALGDRE